MTNEPHDLGSAKAHWLLLVLLVGIAMLAVMDLASDRRDGAFGWHIAVEATVALMAGVGVFFLVRHLLALRQALHKAQQASQRFQQEAAQWRLQAKTYLSGLSKQIDAQLSAWGLSPAERDVAFFLLKGISLKDIAQLRGTSEKTARVQSMAVYAKSGLAGRSELAAFFLEDLLPPVTDADTGAVTDTDSTREPRQP